MRPAGRGRAAVRAIRASCWRSTTWLSAAAPPPVSAVPAISPSSAAHSMGPVAASRYPEAAIATTNAVIPGFESSR